MKTHETTPHCARPGWLETLDTPALAISPAASSASALDLVIEGGCLAAILVPSGPGGVTPLTVNQLNVVNSLGGKSWVNDAKLCAQWGLWAVISSRTWAQSWRGEQSAMRPKTVRLHFPAI